MKNDIYCSYKLNKIIWQGMAFTNTYSMLVSTRSKEVRLYRYPLKKIINHVLLSIRQKNMKKTLETEFWISTL